MATECIAQVTFDVQGLRQPVVARFDQPHASSDGGAVLLKALDARLGVTERLAASLIDDRQRSASNTSSPISSTATGRRLSSWPRR